MNDAAASTGDETPAQGRQHAADLQPTVDAHHPWLGLASFTEETRGYFYGREEEIAELARRVQRKRLTILFGQSGLGKTSILRAGIVPRLRPEGYCPVYVRIDYSPEAPSPTEQIKQAIFRATESMGAWTQAGAIRAWSCCAGSTECTRRSPPYRTGCPTRTFWWTPRKYSRPIEASPPPHPPKTAR